MRKVEIPTSINVSMFCQIWKTKRIMKQYIQFKLHTTVRDSTFLQCFNIFSWDILITFIEWKMTKKGIIHSIYFYWKEDKRVVKMGMGCFSSICVVRHVPKETICLAFLSISRRFTSTKLDFREISGRKTLVIHGYTKTNQ